MNHVVAVAAGGAIGSVIRFGIQKWLNLSFPFGTLTANLVGCFLAGWLMAALAKGINPQVYLLLMTGFCGGFTTFSAFSAEAIQMAVTNRWLYFGLYILASVSGGLLATFFAYKIFNA